MRDGAIAAALDRNPRVLAAEARARATSIETDVAASGLLPQLDFVIGGGPAGSSADVRRQVATAVVRGVVAVHTAGRRATVLSRSTQAAELDLAAERARFDSGRSTNFDVLRRQDQLALAKLGALVARLDYARALADVESLTGAILDRYGVKVP